MFFGNAFFETQAYCRLGRRSNASFCAVFFFLSAEVWERVSEQATAAWLFRHLSRSESKSEIDSAKKEQENRRFVVTKTFAESCKCCAEILNFLKPSKLRFSFGNLCSWSNRLLMQASTFPCKGKCWDVLLIGMVAGWNRPRRDFCVACMYRKWGECRKPSENVNCLASYSVADFQKPTGYFHSHLCLWQDFTRAKFAWPQKRPLLSEHDFAWSKCRFFSKSNVCNERLLCGLLSFSVCPSPL